MITSTYLDFGNFAYSLNKSVNLIIQFLRVRQYILTLFNSIINCVYRYYIDTVKAGYM